MSLLKYNPTTGIYKSKKTEALIPDNISIYDFLFHYEPPKAVTYYDVPTPILRSSPSERENKTWMVDALTGRSLTFRQVRERSLSIAQVLHARGLGPDDAVAIFSGNEIDFATTIWATFRLGGIITAANPAYGVEELQYQLELVKDHHPIKLLLVAADTIKVAVAALEGLGLSTEMIVLIAQPAPDATAADKALAAKYPSLDDLVKRHTTSAPLPAAHVMKSGEAKTKLAFLLFSSGTTGRPKAVMIPHYALIANTCQSVHHWAVTGNVLSSQDRVLAFLPFFHIYGLVVVLHQTLFMDTTIYTLNKFTLPTFCASVEKYKLTAIYVVPPVVIGLVKSPSTVDYDLSSLSIGMSGAAPMTEEIGNALKAKLPNLMLGQGYGMTESATIITIFDPSVDVIPQSSAGTLAPNIEAKVVNTAGKPVGFGEIGELWSRSPSNALGYLANQKATDETFDSEGFLHTGDEVYFSKEGWLFVVDRIKELIKVSGNQVAPAELEGLLLDHQFVDDCCVIGIPDDRFGEVPRAFVVLNLATQAKLKSKALTEDQVISDIKKFVEVKKIKYKHLTGGVQFMDAIPKTASGKLLRRELRVMYATSIKEKREKL